MNNDVLPEYRDVQRAAERLEGVAHVTPVMDSKTFDELTGAHVVFKCEHLQRMGAFKFRGAYNALAANRDAIGGGVLTFSSGNHAQATALSARLMGVPATVLMPQGAAQSKVTATEGYGGKVMFYDRFTQDREEIARGMVEREGMRFLSPFEDPLVIAGQGTAAKELFEAVGELDYLFAPLGGGGLLAGVAIAAAHLSPDCKVIGVEPEAGDDGRRSMEAGHVVTIEPPHTLADGALVSRVGELNFAIMQRHVHRVVTVSDDEIVAAMRFMAQRMKQIIEPTGALAAAAVMHKKLDIEGKRVGVILSGGNVDLPRFCTLVGAQ